MCSLLVEDGGVCVAFCITHPNFFLLEMFSKVSQTNLRACSFLVGGGVCLSYCITDPGPQYVARSCFSRQLFQDFKLYRKFNITDIDF